jgi:multidrug efflux pump subunit AcrA (membrane-fusion protein)
LEGQIGLQAAIQSADAELLAAGQALKALEENAATSRAQALQAIIQANQDLGEAKRRLYYHSVTARLAGLQPMEALEITRENLDQARLTFEPYKHEYNPYEPFNHDSSYDNRRDDLKEDLDRAQSEYNAALRWVELEANLVSAQTNLEEAERWYGKLADGPDPDQVALGQARLDNAQAQLMAAQKALDQLVLTAPFASSVVSVDICAGEAVLPGQVIVVLGELANLHVETSDLSERDIHNVTIGQSASVYVEALDLQIPGRVSSISPQANTIGGDVVYTVEIQLEEQPAGLRWGMSVDVEIDIE